jgi:hypothetical protein
MNAFSNKPQKNVVINASSNGQNGHSNNTPKNAHQIPLLLVILAGVGCAVAVFFMLKYISGYHSLHNYVENLEEQQLSMEDSLTYWKKKSSQNTQKFTHQNNSNASSTSNNTHEFSTKSNASSTSNHATNNHNNSHLQASRTQFGNFPKNTLIQTQEVCFYLVNKSGLLHQDCTNQISLATTKNIATELTYQSLSSQEKLLKLDFKLFNPQNQLVKKNYSIDDTHSQIYLFKSQGTSYKINLGRWLNSNDFQEKGAYQLEIWSNQQKIAQTSFEVF